MSNLPESTVYGGPISKTAVKRVTLRYLAQKYAAGQVCFLDSPPIKSSFCETLSRFFRDRLLIVYAAKKSPEPFRTNPY
jgi:hypothetical protein